MAGRVFDRQTNPTTNQGQVTAAAVYDFGAKMALARANKISRSPYAGIEDDRNASIGPMDALFAAPGVPGSHANQGLAVLGAVNGLGSEAAQLYPNDPEMQAACVRNQIQYVGFAYQALSGEPIDALRGITVQMHGLKTVPVVGNSNPGDMMEVFVPEPGKMYATVNELVNRGSLANKATLLVRRASADTPGKALRKHILEILREPTDWKMAMGERLLGTRAWATAAHEVMNSALASGMIVLEHALAIDYVRLGTLGEHATADLGAGAGSYAHVARLASIIGLIDGTLPAAGAPLAPAEKAKLNNARDEMLQRIFYDAGNPAFEYGAPRAFDAAGNVKNKWSGRSGKEVNLATDIGKMLDVQLNHTTRAVQGFYWAVLDARRFHIGKNVTGSSPKASGNAHIHLGVGTL